MLIGKSEATDGVTYSSVLSKCVDTASCREDGGALCAGFLHSLNRSRECVI